jgi:hypothetical protein
MDTINRLTEILVAMNTPKDRGKLFKIMQMLYGLMVLRRGRADGRRRGIYTSPRSAGARTN